MLGYELAKASKESMKSGRSRATERSELTVGNILKSPESTINL